MEFWYLRKVSTPAKKCTILTFLRARARRLGSSRRGERGIPASSSRAQRNARRCSAGGMSAATTLTTAFLSSPPPSPAPAFLGTPPSAAAAPSAIAPRPSSALTTPPRRPAACRPPSSCSLMLGRRSPFPPAAPGALTHRKQRLSLTLLSVYVSVCVCIIIIIILALGQRLGRLYRSLGFVKVGVVASPLFFVFCFPSLPGERAGGITDCARERERGEFRVASRSRTYSARRCTRPVGYTASARSRPSGPLLARDGGRALAAQPALLLRASVPLLRVYLLRDRWDGRTRRA